MIQVRNSAQVEYSSLQQTIRLNNTMLLFNIIRDHMPISRAELAKIGPLSSSTISNLVDELLAQNWIIETSVLQTTSRGRRSIMLEVNAGRGYVAVVDLLSRGFICTVYNICLEKVASTRIRNTLYDNTVIRNTILQLLKAEGIPSDMLLGIHLIFPGVVDTVSGDLIRSLVIPEEEIIDRHLVLQLKKYFPGAHVMINSYGAVIAFEEFISQESPLPLPLLSLNVDEAIFGGVVLCDQNSSVNFCIPLELGHTVIDYNGARCKCSNRGCLETLCATPMLLKSLNERAGMTLTFSESFGADGNVAAIRDAAARLDAGDAAVLEVVRDYAYALCCGLISVINLLNIRSIRIGGDIALLGDRFIEILQSTLRESFSPLNNTYTPQLSLFVNDYEQIRLAATTMCLDVLFRN